MNLQVIKNRVRKALAYGLTAILFIIVSSFLVLQIPPVQNAIVGRLLKNFSGITGFKSTIESFHLYWFDRLELKGVSIRDTENNEMISAKKILVNFKLLQFFNQQDVHIDGIVVDSAHVFLTKVAESDSSRDLNINLLIYQINQKFSSGKKTGRRSPRINIGEAIVNNSLFSYVDQYRDTVRRGFDYNHFRLHVDEGQLRNFLVLGDTVEFDVATLLVEDQKTNFRIKQLSTFFRISQSSMEFVGLDLQAGESTVNDTVIFTYNSQRDLNDFVNKVKVYAHLENTIIYPKDLALFAPATERIGKPVTLKGTMNGPVRKFRFSDMEAAMGNTRLLGDLEMDGLPDINETFIILNLKNSQIDFEDFNFLFNDKVMTRLDPFGKVSLNGQFLGYPTDFVANGDFSGKLGRVKSDINFKVNESDIDRSSYTGRLTMIDFDLGEYFSDTASFQKVSLDGRVKGSGLTLGTANFKLDGTVSSLGIKGYNYKNIITNAQFASEFFNGLIKINDPNLEFTAQGSIDLRKNRNIVKVQATLDKAYLHNLKLTPEEIFIQTNVDIDITGLQLDSLVGQANFQNFTITYQDQSLLLDTIYLNSQRLFNDRDIRIESSLVDAQIKGNFLVSDVTRDVQTLLREISLNIRNNKEEIAQYYREKKHRPGQYQASFKVNLKNVDPISQLLNVDFKVTSQTSLEGSFTSGYTTIFRAFTFTDSLYYDGNLFLNTEAEITVSKIADSTSVLGLALFNSEQQALRSGLKTRDLLVEGVWNKNHIDFEMDCYELEKDNYVKLQGIADFLRDSTAIKILPSSIHLLERDWHIEAKNEIAVTGKEWKFKNVEFVNGEQSVQINGFVSEDSSKSLIMQATQFDLSLLNVVSAYKFSGILNANIVLNNLYKNPTIENDIVINKFTVEDFLVGDIEGMNHWDNLEKKFHINVFVDKSGERVINLQGYYTPSDKEDPLNIAATLDNTNLRIIQPFLTGVFSNISGTINGTYKITGTLASPSIAGEGQISDGYLVVDYLKTSYQFEGRTTLKPNSINFNNIQLTDSYKNTASLNGLIAHRNFSDMRIDLDARFQNFQVLNTSSKDNNLFYGQAYASGNVNFFGPLQNLRISSTARTEKNTRIYIPVSGSASAEKKEFINFISFNDSLSTTINADNKPDNTINLTGVTLDLNVDVTPDAYCEIIFDIKTGDIIRGRGNGDLLLQMDTKGEFNMFGVVEFEEGWYNFTLYDIINKEFTVKKGSRITWFGDPYAATLDISAFYNQYASYAPIVDYAIGGTTSDQATTSTELRRKYPVQVLLKLEGPMLSPDFKFDIISGDIPQTIIVDGNPVRLDIAFQAFKNKLDEQELSKQVFSLIVLRKFSPPASFAINTGSSLYNSVSELLSNQLSYWMSQMDENLEIDVDLGTMDDEAFNTFQLRLSYTLLGGRLRITRDGTFGNDYSNLGDNNRGNLASIAGDWTVDYFLTADGKFKVKMYNRTNYNPLATTLSNQNYFTAGFSLQHVQSFNEVKDLLRRSRDRRRKKDNSVTGPQTNEEAIREENESGQ